jgi:ATP-dependent Clp protease ATP-binding subunit ClpC
VGKTELAKTLAEFLFGSEEALIKLDMSEFMERHNVSRLVGAPPGYVGYEEGGQLTEAVRRRPYCVILFDELEKAHPEAHNMLLQIMEDGYLSDAKGRRVDFRNAILIMTSNVGAKLIKRASKLGFAFTADDEAKREHDYENMKERVMDALKQAFRPEFINRLDGVMVFRHLSKDELTQIVDLELKRVHLQLSEHDITLEMTQEAKLYLADEGYDPDYGARPLRRVVQNHVEDALSEGMLAGNFKPGDTVAAKLVTDEEGKQQLDLEVTASKPIEPKDDDAADELLQLALA